MSKFSSDLDELIYVASLDGGADEEVGDVQDFGWYGILRLAPEDVPDFQKLADEEGLEISDEDLETLRTYAGVILYEDSQGFVDATFYDKADKLEAAWADLLEEAEEFYGEGEESEEEEEEEAEEGA